jgi:hypothetical protein
MPYKKDPIFHVWWPLGQALELVRGPIERVAKALQSLLLDGECQYQFEWLHVPSLDALFRQTQRFANFPTIFYALPTHSAWTVLWNNYYHGGCGDPYHLAKDSGLEGLAFSSSDVNSIQLAGTSFIHCRPTGPGEEPMRRSVYCCNQGSRWHFEQWGEPLPEEDLSRYQAKLKRNRLDEEGMMALLAKLGLRPWHEDFYDLARQKCFCATRLDYPGEVYDFVYVRGRASGGEPLQEDDVEIEGPPDYLKGRCKPAVQEGPARLLQDGAWCGHGEKTYFVFDIQLADCDEFHIELPVVESGNPPLVRVTSTKSGRKFAIYDSRRHPASCFYESKKTPQLQPRYRCPKCVSERFRVAVGFEIPIDVSSSNDTSWFALAATCVSCGAASVVYDDETA